MKNPKLVAGKTPPSSGHPWLRHPPTRHTTNTQPNKNQLIYEQNAEHAKKKNCHMKNQKSWRMQNNKNTPLCSYLVGNSYSLIW